MRKVGEESSKTHQHKLCTGFYSRYMSGNGLDIGYAGYIPGVEPILETAIGIDMNYPGYNGRILPFADESQNYVYNSHCLEHISHDKLAIREWFRVLKTNGYLVVVVPHMYLYEKKTSTPSKWNEDHQRFYTPGSLLIDIENTLLPNTYRVRLLEDGDKGFNYDIDPNSHSDGQYEITLVIQKIKPPTWSLA